jgi:hypothetical protein
MDALGLFASLVAFLAALAAYATRQTRAHGLGLAGAGVALVTAYRAL